MPLITQTNKDSQQLSKNKYSRGPNTLDREQLEYSAQTLFKYGTILFLAVGVYASVAYVMVKQLKKD